MTNFEFVQKKYRESLQRQTPPFDCTIGLSSLAQCHTRQLGHWRAKLWTNPMFVSCRGCAHWLKDEEYAVRKQKDYFIPVELTRLIYRKRIFENLTEPRPYTYVDNGMPAYTPADDEPDVTEIDFKEIRKLKTPDPEVDEGPDELNKVETPGENAETERPGGGNGTTQREIVNRRKNRDAFDWRKDLPDEHRWKI
jgi:hypothetical protein